MRIILYLRLLTLLMVLAAHAGAEEKSGTPLSDDDKHRLFQAAAMAGDEQTIMQMLKLCSLITTDGVPNTEYEPFIKAHEGWAQTNVQFILDTSDPEKAKEYAIGHGLTVPDPASAAAAPTSAPPGAGDDNTTEGKTSEPPQGK